jgi:Na+/melibiose symporter-like transporter
MAYFKAPTDVGVGNTFLVMGALYFCFMMFGVFMIRVPREGWKPENWTAPVKPQALITTHDVDVSTAVRTPQFWLLWIILCVNVTAGIGILEQASPMIQDLFKGMIGPVAAGGFVGLLSLLNMGGRFFWSSASDFIGRKPTYFIFLALGAALYVFLPMTGGDHINSVKLFVTVACVLISMYGGGFATMVMHIMTGLLVVGFIANFLVKPVAEKYWLPESASLGRSEAFLSRSNRSFETWPRTQNNLLRH